MKKALTGDLFSHHGEFFHYDKVCLQPTPLQRPHTTNMHGAAFRAHEYRAIPSGGIAMENCRGMVCIKRGKTLP